MCGRFAVEDFMETKAIALKDNRQILEIEK